MYETSELGSRFIHHRQNSHESNRHEYDARSSKIIRFMRSVVQNARNYKLTNSKFILDSGERYPRTPVYVFRVTLLRIYARLVLINLGNYLNVVLGYTMQRNAARPTLY